METPAVEMEEGGAGVEVDYLVVDAEAGPVRNEKEVEGGEGVRSVVAMEDDAGGEEEASSVVVSAAAATVVVEVDMVEQRKGKERRDPGGRKKRKERENGGGEGGEGGEVVKEDRKKRRDEKERRKGRDAVEGSEKREHREGRDRKDDRKDGKRKKDRKDKKERREERDGKNRKNVVLTEEEEWEQLERKTRDGRLEKQIGESHRREILDHDAVVVCHERRTSRSVAETEDQMLVDNNSVGTTHRRNSGFVVESVVKALLVDDDDKEEGEILDEESGGPARVAESETESGEIQTVGEMIQTLDDANRTGAGADMTEVATISVHDSLGGIERSRWNSPPPVEAMNSLSEHSMLDRNGTSSNKEDAQEKVGQAAPPNPLQSMLVIAEAYDSESPASEEKNAFPSAASRRNYNRKTENGSRKSELYELDRKSSGVEKSKAQDKDDVKSQSTGPLEQRSNEPKDRKVVNVEDETRSKAEDNKVRSSRRNEARSGNNSERGEVKEQPIVDRPKSLVTRTSDSPEIEESGQQVGRNRANDSRRHRSPSPNKGVLREKDHRRGRSRSKERRSERGRSRSLESTKGREYNRRRTRSPELARERSSRKGRSPSRESLRDRRTVVRESTERRKRSRSRDSGPERRHSRDKTESVDRRRRSRSRESGRVRALARGDSDDRRRRSRSRESPRDKNRNVSRRADSVERRRRSSSRSIRDRRIEDRITSRHSDAAERRRRSRSRDSLRDRKLDDRDSGRLGRRGDDSRHRSGRDDRSFHDGSRDSNYRTDRDRNRNYSNLHDKDLQSKGSQQSARDSMAAEAIREAENQEEYQERVASQLAAQEEDDVERIKEESRKRRQAILEKYKKQQERPEQPTLTQQGHMANGSMADVDVPPLMAPSQKLLSPVLVSAPSDVSLSLGKLPNQNGALPLAAGAEAGGLGAGSPKSERSADMFCDDIFGESPAGGRRLGKGDGLAMDTSGLIDNWDDAEGYYCFRIGEVLDGRYEVASSHGRGVFSTVVRARDMKAGRGEPEEVAIKIIRNNETMYKAGQQELVILKKLAGADPENKRHCVRLLSSFEYRSHLCLVFESLHMNLREILKKFGRNIGINLNAVRAYAKQLFISLKHLRNCGVLHCDIKPDNMLVNESKNVLKLCDFGSAMFAGENEITPYLVSRFYRAPEIILGLPYDHALDIWSVGCCLYELYTGKMLFPGHTNNDMLRLHMELKGPFPKKMLKKAAFADQHFDQDFNFCAIEEDPVTKKAIKRILANVKPRDMGILVSGSGTIDEDSQMLSSFKDLLEKIFILDPDRRLTVSQALSHSFISGK